MHRLLAWLQLDLVGRALFAVLAAVVLLVGLDATGFWEPQELAAADRAVARREAASKPRPAAARATPGAKAATTSDDTDEPDDLEAEDDPDEVAPAAAAAADPPAGPCPKVAPKKDGARTATEQLVARRTSERGMRFPLALCGLLVVAGCVGIGARLLGPRAGLLAGLICLSFPLLSLQSRQLTSEIPTAAGATLLIYAFTIGLRPGRGRWLWIDLATGLPALVIGALLGFYGGGALHGLLVPIGAFALAVATSLRRHDLTVEPGRVVAGALAAAATIALIVVLAVQVYDLRPPIPGSRELLGHSIVPSECWSTALGALWRFDDDLRMTYDSSFEQIGFGTFPWGIAAPMAVGLLMASRRRDQQTTGALALSWAGAAWLATEVFQRKVGFTIYAGFPAMALAIGGWLDGVLAARRADERGEAGAPAAIAPDGLVPGLFVLLGVLTLGKDLQAFPERLTSLLVGSDAIKYPKQAVLLGLPLKLWVLALGLSVATAFALSLWSWTDRPDPGGARRRLLSDLLLRATLVATAAVALFWVHGWHRALSRNLSTKGIFNTYQDAAAAGDTLGIMGDLGNAPVYYAHGPHEKIPGRTELLTFLERPSRVFAMVPAAELCAIHRSANGKFFVLDNSNTRTLLLSNRIGRPGDDKNPLTTLLLRAEPTDIPNRPAGRVVYDDRIELLGWKLPPKVGRGDDFEVTLFFKVLRPVGGTWKIFAHFDGPGAVRFQGDHTPIADRCPTSYWQEGDYIVDRFTVEAGDSTHQLGSYDLRVGFFTGSNPTWRNMKVTQAPPGSADSNDRVRLGPIQLR
ncbi:MAG: glycosyltransferase family 39 protein [Kofleriaceae bacterium]|nr:glycosyltransferase family 39 protein [Kofleriaceae bacterium]